MKRSIRSFLLIYLLAGVTLVILFVTATNVYITRKTLREHVAFEFLLTYLVHQKLFDFYEFDISRKKASPVFPSTSTKSHQTNEIVKITTQDPYKQTPIFILGENNNAQSSLFNRSFFTKKNEASFPFPWRAENIHDPYKSMYREIHEISYVSKNEIANLILWTSLLALVCLGTIVWFTLTRGLASIKQVTDEIKNRDPSNLQPVKLDSVPTEIKPLIQELNSLFIKVGEAFLHEERFSANAAHELRTPIAALRAHVHVALNATSEEERKNTLHKIIASIDRSTHVISQLLTLHRMTELKASEQKRMTQVSLANESQAIIADLYPLIKRKNIDIELITEENTPPIYGNPVSIGILIRNLIDNAIRYIETNGIIKVIIARDHDEVVLKVIDNGPGIPDDMCEKVFERFFRLAGSNIQGSGLGLNIVQQIAILHHAKIQLKKPDHESGLEVNVIFKMQK